MKWKLPDFFKPKRKTKKRPARRITGKTSEVAPRYRFLGLWCLYLAIIAALLGGVGVLFNTYYFGSDELFGLDCIDGCVEIKTGKNLTPEIIRQILELDEASNLFRVPIDKKRQEMMERAAGIKEMTIVRRLPNKLMITVIERNPIARIGTAGRVVDEEGVVFMQNTGTSGLPLIVGQEELMKAAPGTQLRGYEMTAVYLAQELRNPSCDLRINKIDLKNTDYLVLHSFEQQSVKFSWEGMGQESVRSYAAMCRQLNELEKSMNSEAGKRCKSFNATVPNRISVVPFDAS